MSASVAAGRARSRRSIALSTRTPEGVPSLRRRMRPPSGSRVSVSIPAARSAAVLTQTAWPSTRRATAGRPGSALSSVRASGNSLPGQRFWSQPRPSAHAPSGSAAADACMAAAAASASLRPRRSAISRDFPRPARCRCASAQPAYTNAPPRSTTRARPASFFAFAGSPTKRIRPSAATIEAFRGFASASAYTTPFSRSRSGFGAAASGDGRRRRRKSGRNASTPES